MIARILDWLLRWRRTRREAELQRWLIEVRERDGQ